MSSDFVVPKGGGVLTRLRVPLGAKKTGFQSTYGDEALKPRVAAPPVGGRANVRAERFLADLAGVASSDARVVRGLSARDKAVFVGGVDAARGEISSRLP